MEETRAAMQNKLETLEGQVRQTVLEATETVAQVTETVTSVKDSVEKTVEAITGSVASVEQTVANVTDTVESTVASVTGSVESTVANVKETLNLSNQVRAHPWAMVAGAAAVGFVAGKMLDRYAPRPAQRTAEPSMASAPSLNITDPMTMAAAERPHTRHRNGHSASKRPAKPQTSLWNSLLAHYSKDLDKVKSLAIATASEMLSMA